MTKNPHLKHLLDSFSRSKHKFSDSINYFHSQYRYYIYYHPQWQLMRFHIREQIDFRIQVMNRQCYSQGSCIHCGCTTTALQMSNRTCEGKEYPPILSKRLWQLFSEGRCGVNSKNSPTTWRMVVTKSISTLIVTDYTTKDKKIHEVQLRTPMHIALNKIEEHG